MAEMGNWGAGAGAGVTGMGGAGYVANMGGMAGTSGLYDSVNGVNGRAVGMACLQAASACAAGAATFSSVASVSGAGAAVGAALGMVTDAVSGGLDAYDANKCMARLEQLEGAAMALHVRGDKDATTVLEAIQYCSNKQRIKMRKGVGKATIVGQPGVHMYRAGKAVYKAAKGTKGVNRAKYSGMVVEIAKKQSPAGTIAREVIAAIMKTKFEDVAKQSLADAMKSG